MQATQAKTITVLTIATMFGLGMGKSIVVDQQFPPFRFFAATGFAAFLLSAAADVEPEVAGPFALLILTVVFLEEAPPLIQALDGTPSAPTTRRPAARRPPTKTSPATKHIPTRR